MKRLLTSFIAVALLLALGVVALSPFSPVAQAQDGGDLSEEELALLQRIVDANDNIDELESFTEMTTVEETQDMTLGVMGFQLTQSSSTSMERSSTVIGTGADRNIQSNMTVVYNSSESGLEGDLEASYTIEAEVRVVDGTVYVNANYTESSGDVPALPEGWTEVGEDSALLDLAFSELALNDVFDMIEGDDEDMADENPLEDFERLSQIVSAVTLETDTLSDGTEVDVITVTIGSEGLFELMEAEGEVDTEDPFMAGLMDLFRDSFSMTLTYKLDAEDTPREWTFDMTMSIDASELDFSELADDVPEGTTAELVMEMTMSETTTLSDINADLEPVEAPGME